MNVRGTGLVAALAAIWFAFAAVQSAQAASVSNSILVGGYARACLDRSEHREGPQAARVQRGPRGDGAQDKRMAGR